MLSPWWFHNIIVGLLFPQQPVHAHGYGCTGEGADEVDPELVKCAGEQRRAEGARRVERSAGQRPTHQDSQSQGQADSQAGEVAGFAAYCGLQHRVDQQEGQDGFEHHTLERGDAAGEHGRAQAAGGAAQYKVQQRAANRAADELRDPVVNRFAPGERARKRRAEGHRRVDVGARNVPVSVDEGHYGQAVGEGHADQAADAQRPRAESATSPGCGVLTQKDGYPVVGTSSGILVLEEVQPAGKRPMRGDVFLRGARNWPAQPDQSD